MQEFGMVCFFAIYIGVNLLLMFFAPKASREKIGKIAARKLGIK